MSKRLGSHAIVIGGSIAGMFTARALSDHYDKVTILDRDEFPADPSHRKGAPQGYQSHVLLKGGELVTEKFFPGFYDELTGLVPVIDSKDVAWYHYGVWRLRLKTGMKKYLMTRPFLEFHIRRRTRQIENIEFLENVDVLHLLATEGNTKVTGVKIEHRGDSTAPSELLADLVVDCGGRGSSAPKFLEQLGYSRPEETTIKIDIGYSSRLYKMPEGLQMDWQYILIYPKPPHGTRIGIANTCEDGKIILSLAGCAGDYPPTDEEGFMEYLKSIPQKDLYDVIKQCEPASEIKSHRLPSSLRRHYESMTAFPENYLVLGDAVCSVNPVFGQGMSISTMSANALKESLDEYAAAGGSDFHAMRKNFYTRATDIINLAWNWAVAEDFRYPNVEGKKPPFTGLQNWYLGNLFELAASNKRIYFQVNMVLNLVAKPRTLLQPYILWQVVRKTLGFQDKGMRTMGNGHPIDA